MKSRFLIFSLGLMLVSEVAYSQIPTLDIPGTIQAAIEVGNTANNVQEGVSQVKQYQKTMAAIGTAKKTVSDFVTNQKEKLQKKLEKVQEYKKQAEEYKAKAESYAAKAKAAYEVGKAAASGDVAGAVSSMGGISPEVDKLQSVAQKGLDAKDQAVEYKKQAEEGLAMAKEAGAAVKNKVEGAIADTGLNAEGRAVEVKQPASVPQTSGVSGLAEMPSATPMRRPIEMLSASTVLPKETIADKAADLKFKAEAVSAAAKLAEKNEVPAEKMLPAEKAADLKFKTEAVSAAVKPADIKSSGLKGESLPAKVDSFQRVKAIKTESLEKTTDYPAAPIQRRPSRATFKTSVGYGQMRVSYPLAFADLSTIKSGTTEDGVLIVPESLSLYCSSLNYEQSAEKDAFADCLRKTNSVVYSEQTDEITAEDINDARNDISNGYAEYLAAAYFEALDIYNESLTFKNNVVDPVKTAETPDVQSAWIYAKEMNRIVGTRINALNKLWSRALSIDAYKQYANEGIKNRDK